MERLVIENQQRLLERWNEYFKSHGALATNVRISEDSLTVELVDGRVLSAPIGWYPRLMHGTAQERGHWRFIGGGSGVHWPDLDEDISVENLLSGKPSGESQSSFKKWLESRQST